MQHHIIELELMDVIKEASCSQSQEEFPHKSLPYATTVDEDQQKSVHFITQGFL
jgi:hypothetical protein